MNNFLIEELLELAKHFGRHGIALILGGGMSLYLRQMYLGRSTRYPFATQVRSTNDLDFFLTAHIISNLAKMGHIRDILLSNGYQVHPAAKNFQFVKNITHDKISHHEIKVDLLTSPPSASQRSLVEINKPRIKPKGIDGIHAYLTPEAEGIDIHPVEVKIPLKESQGDQSQASIYIPSSFNYLILKLHAFDDRKNRADGYSDYGRHHAYDIFATVSAMDDKDWDLAKEHLETHQRHQYVINACNIRQECFSTQTSIGLIRLRENAEYRKNKDQYDAYLELFITDLKDLFPKSGAV